MGIHGFVQTAALTSTASMILGTDSKRRSILFSPPSTGFEYTVSTERDVTPGAGLVLGGGGGAVEVTRESYGDAVTRPWFAVASGSLVVGLLVASGDGEEER